MNPQDFQKLQKIYSLAVENPNNHEAATAALKFVKTIRNKKLYLKISDKPHVEPPSQEQIDEALEKAYAAGIEEGMKRMKNIMEVRSAKTIATNSNGQFWGTTSSGNTILFHN